MRYRIEASREAAGLRPVITAGQAVDSGLPTDTAPLRPRRSGIPGWLIVPALLAPGAVTAGWIVGALLQRYPYSSVRNTISDLAATTADHRDIMTTGFLVAGLSLLAVALGLREAALSGRFLIGIGGIGVLLVAANPLPNGGTAHTYAAFVSFISLSIWPGLATRRDSSSWALRPPASWLATLAGCVLLFCYVSISPAFGLSGAAERALATFDTSWPLVVVVASRLGCRARDN